MSDFLYPIGAVLVHRAALAATPDRDPLRLFVVGRLAEECPGGVQRHYLCRAVARHHRPGISEELYRLNEVELAPLPEPARPQE